MKFKLAIAGVTTFMLLTGCAGTAVGLSTTNSPSLGGSLPPPGTSYSSAAIQAEVRPNIYFGVLFFGYVMTGVADTYQRWSDGPSWRKPPDLDEGRAIADRDCSQPLGPLYANLRCN
jgi:hypothetical protein